MKILVIGGGNMGMTYTQSFLRSHITTPENIMILEKSPEKAEELKKLNLGSVHGQPETCLERAQLIIMAVNSESAAEPCE